MIHALIAHYEPSHWITNVNVQLLVTLIMALWFVLVAMPLVNHAKAQALLVQIVIRPSIIGN